MAENITTEMINNNEGYQILITGISWNKESVKTYRTKSETKVEDLPDQFTLDLPENIMNQAKKKHNIFNDVIETFVYNFLTHKFGHEVYHCQIWLPLEDKNIVA